jgi:1-acyl-sn-glycerol-3-phosphate acyltransferase
MRWFPLPETPQEHLYLWRLLYPIVRAVALFFAPMRTIDLENVPARGPYIIVANHISWLDPEWIAWAVWKPVKYMAKEEIFEWFFVGGFIRFIGCFPVKRGTSDRRAFVTALKVLAGGGVLGFFPEGHRSETGTMITAHPGIAGIALRSGAPIIPVGVTGSRGVFGQFWRRSVTLRFGKPFYAKDLGETESQAVADAMMRKVAELLPESMHGVYAVTPGAGRDRDGATTPP